MREPLEVPQPVLHATGSFQNGDGQRLFEQAWRPADDARAIVVLVHGYAEHSSRYEYTGEYLAARGYAVHLFDLRGHGRSEGDRVFVRSFREHLDDLALFLARVRDPSRTTPLFLLGHSMGGTIVALDAVMRRSEVDGVILSGAGLTMRSGNRLALGAMMLLGRVVPKLPLRKLEAAAVSRDPEVVSRYDSDPLVYRGKMPAGTLAAMIRAIRAIEHRMSHATRPLLILHGSEDALTDPNGSRELFRRALSTDKTLEIYQGLYHEILNEPERDDVLADIASWLDSRTAGRPTTNRQRVLDLP